MEEFRDGEMLFNNFHNLDDSDHMTLYSDLDDRSNYNNSKISVKSSIKNQNIQTDRFIFSPENSTDYKADKELPGNLTTHNLYFNPPQADIKENYIHGYNSKDQMNKTQAEQKRSSEKISENNVTLSASSPALLTLNVDRNSVNNFQEIQPPKNALRNLMRCYGDHTERKNALLLRSPYRSPLRANEQILKKKSETKRKSALKKNVEAGDTEEFYQHYRENDLSNRNEYDSAYIIERDNVNMDSRIERNNVLSSRRKHIRFVQPNFESTNSPPKQRFASVNNYIPKRDTKEFPYMFHKNTAESCCSSDTCSLVEFTSDEIQPKKFYCSKKNMKKLFRSPYISRRSHSREPQICSPKERHFDNFKYPVNSPNLYSRNSSRRVECDFQEYSKFRIPDHELWKRFDRIFRSYASTRRHSGELISWKISTQWMIDMGVVDDFLTKRESKELFKTIAGAKITMNVHEYKEFIHTVTMKMKLPFYEIYRRMCGINV